MFLGLFALYSYGQLTEQQKQLYERKIQSYERMKNLGGAFIPGGVVVAGAGLYMMFEGNSQQTVDLGEVVVTLGTGLFVSGIIFSIVGKRKMKQYKEKLDLGIAYNQRMKGITLVYRF